MEKTYTKTQDGFGLKVVESKPVEQSYSRDYIEKRRAELATQQAEINKESDFLNTLDQKFVELKVKEEPIIKK